MTQGYKPADLAPLCPVCGRAWRFEHGAAGWFPACACRDEQDKRLGRCWRIRVSYVANKWLPTHSLEQAKAFASALTMHERPSPSVVKSCFRADIELDLDLGRWPERSPEKTFTKKPGAVDT
jgi:hypothetical protein